MPIANPTDISTVNSRTTVQNVACAWVAKSIIPIMSAIPTGSFAPDSPSRIVPLCPATSRLPSTENMTAGSVGASAGTEDVGRRPREVEQVAGDNRHHRSGRKCPNDPERRDRQGRCSDAVPADMHPALEEDDDKARRP
jgi:hypothetical protein